MKHMTIVSCFFAGLSSSLLGMGFQPAGTQAQQPKTILEIAHHVKTTQPIMQQSSIADALLRYLHQSSTVDCDTLAALLSRHAGLPVIVHDFKNPHIQISFSYPGNNQVNTQPRWYELNELIHLLCLVPSQMRPTPQQAQQNHLASLLLFDWNKDNVAESMYMVCYNSLIMHAPMLQRLLKELHEPTHHTPSRIDTLLEEYNFLAARSGTVSDKLLEKRCMLKNSCPDFFSALFGVVEEEELEPILCGEIVGYIIRYFCTSYQNNIVTSDTQDTETLNIPAIDETVQRNVDLFKATYTNPNDKKHMMAFVREFLFL